MQTPTSMGTFGCLPREIRDEIYHMVLCGVYTLKIRKSGENSDNAGELAQSPHLALLFTSKQLHEEAIIVFYEASAFKLKVSLCATDNVQYPALTLTNCNLMTNICFQITTGSWKDFDEFLDEDKAQSKKVKTLMSLFTSNRTTRNKVVFSFVFRPETRRVIWDPSGPEVMSTLLQSLFMNWMSYTDLIVSVSCYKLCFGNSDIQFWRTEMHDEPERIDLREMHQEFGNFCCARYVLEEIQTVMEPLLGKSLWKSTRLPTMFGVSYLEFHPVEHQKQLRRDEVTRAL